MARRKRKSRKPDRGDKADLRKADVTKADGKKADQEEKKKSKSATRNLVETVLFVSLTVLAIRWKLLEAFKIPSSSMEPTLIGHPYHGDRVLAWKPSVNWMDPGRWSVNVFVKHPDRYERLRGDDGDKNYIKRLIGRPGERVLIAGGDIFIEAPGAFAAQSGPRRWPHHAGKLGGARIARKLAALQRQAWHAVYDGAELEQSWDLDDGLRFAESGEGASVRAIIGKAEGEAWARFARNHYEDDDGLITNLYVKRLRLRVRCPHEGCGGPEPIEFKTSIRTSRTRFECPSCRGEVDILRDDALRHDMLGVITGGKRPWYPQDRRQEVAVGDLRVSFDVAAERVVEHGKGFVLAELSRDDERYLARVPLGGGEARVSGPHGVDAKAHVAPFGPAAPSGHLVVPTYRGEAKRVSFAHVDQTVVLVVDGEEIIRQEYDLSWTERAGTPRTNGVRIGLEDTSVLFENPRIERDLHYLSRGSMSVVEFYSGERGRGRWRDIPPQAVPGMPPDVGWAPAVRTKERLGEDEYFFMGDNSPSSYDGRMWGAVKAGDMVGRAFFAFWPPHHMGWMH